MRTLKDAEHEQILQALAETNWVIGGTKGAAARLGLQRTTLFYKMKRFGISRAQA
jgi:formate hydrogenlyase transcriptional activator